MNKLIYLLTIFCSMSVSAQVGIGIASVNIDSSAQLDVTSTSKGFLAPRMTEAQRIAINSPANGLLVYQTDGIGGFYYYDGSFWRQSLGLLSGGTANQVLTSDGAGNSVWTTVAASTGIPYTGATSDVDLGVHDLKVNGLTIGKGAWTNYLPATSNNTAIGDSALFNNTGGLNNAAIGGSTLFSNTTGFSNTGTGTSALYSNTTGAYNTAIGQAALISNTSGASNTANGQTALLGNTTGNYNTGIGKEALLVNTTGSYNTAIGYKADVASNNLENATAIGNGAKVAASNTIQLGNTSVTSVKTSGTITADTVTYPNVHGTTGQVLSTAGSGTLIWTTPSVAVIVTDADDEISVTTSQTSFTLTHAPASTSKLKMYINGIRISKTAYSVSGTTLTYDPSFNGNKTLLNTDRIQFEYYY